MNDLLDRIETAVENYRASLSPMDRFIYDTQSKAYSDMLLYGHATIPGLHMTQTRDALVLTKVDATCRHCGEVVK